MQTPSPEENQLREIEQRLQEQPDNISLLKTKALLLQARAVFRIQSGDRDHGYADYEASGDLWRKIKDASADLSREDARECRTALYNRACALSLKQQVDPALAALREAVEAGFANMERFDNDTDLDSLRGDPGFRALLDEIPTLRLAAVRKLVSPDALFAFDFNLPSIHGKSLTSKDYAGKVLIVNLWGTWCGPCRQGIPGLVALRKKWKADLFEIVGINYEREKDPAKRTQVIQSFCEFNNVEFECAIGDEETQQRIPGLGGYPTTLVIDRAGRVRAKFEGPQAFETLESIVELLLSEELAPPP